MLPELVSICKFCDKTTELKELLYHIVNTVFLATKTEEGLTSLRRKNADDLFNFACSKVNKLCQQEKAYNCCFLGG